METVGEELGGVAGGEGGGVEGGGEDGEERWWVREEVEGKEDSRMSKAREIAPSSAPIFVTRAPNGAPISREGSRLSDEKTTPTPAPPEGFGSGEAEPSVKMREQPESRRD
jgi:hypothetical protein